MKFIRALNRHNKSTTTTAITNTSVRYRPTLTNEVIIHLDRNKKKLYIWYYWVKIRIATTHTYRRAEQKQINLKRRTALNLIKNKYQKEKENEVGSVRSDQVVYIGNSKHTDTIVTQANESFNIDGSAWSWWGCFIDIRVSYLDSKYSK